MKFLLAIFCILSLATGSVVHADDSLLTNLLKMDSSVDGKEVHLTSTTEAPSFEPTAEPTTEPTYEPTTSAPTYKPTSAPTYKPTSAPTCEPTNEPTYKPTCAPTYKPTCAPTYKPTCEPTYMPSYQPSSQPSSAPTNTYAPTVKPTHTPTAAPTEIDVVSFVAEQDMLGITNAQYQADAVVNNITVQQTVSSAMNGTVPSDVQNIETEDTTVRRLREHGRKLATNAVKITYLVLVHDETATYESLTSQLSAAQQSGELDASLVTFATNNGATLLISNNASFTAVTTVNVFTERDSSDDLTGAQIAGLLVGIFLLIALIAIIVMFAMASPDSPPADTPAPAPPADEL